MITRQYRFKFFLNARHALEINGKRSTHPHTWEIAIFLIKENEEFVQFTHLEQLIIGHLKTYESKTLNEIKPFDELPPTLEIIGEVLFEQITDLLREAHWRISSLEISETAARSYTIKDSTYNFRGFNPMNAIRRDENHQSILLQTKADKIPKVARIIKAAESTILQAPKLDMDSQLFSASLQNQKKSNAEIETLKAQLATLQAIVINREIEEETPISVEIDQFETGDSIEDSLVDVTEEVVEAIEAVESESEVEAVAQKDELTDAQVLEDDLKPQGLPTIEALTMNDELRALMFEKAMKKVLKKARKKAKKEAEKEAQRLLDESKQQPTSDQVETSPPLHVVEPSVELPEEPVDVMDTVNEVPENDLEIDHKAIIKKSMAPNQPLITKADKESVVETRIVLDDPVVEKDFLSKLLSHIGRHPLYLIIPMLLVSFTLILLWITRNGLSPWGSDTWGHIFKSHFLYKEVMKGNFFPQYTELWYNGLQPFRYWAPVPYYVMIIGELISGGDALFGYYFFVGMVFFVGAVPFIIYGKKQGHIYLGTIIGIMYFILPDNYRLLLAEGNLPRVVVSMIFPYLLLAIFSYFEKRKQRTLIAIAMLMFLITLTHAMIAALVGITLFLFVVIRLVIMKNKVMESLYVLSSAVFGIIASAMWLYPALKGGIVSLDSTGNSTVMETLTYHITQSLNPVYRFIGSSTDAYYFGLAIFIIMILGLFLSKGQAKVSMFVVLIIFLGTTKWFLFALKKLPMSELFWMMRFTPMAMCFFLFGILDWKDLKRKVLYVFLGLMLLDSLVTMNVVKTSLPIHRASQAIEFATSIATQRVAMMDLSTYDSDPSYHISYGNEAHERAQVFGWAWQGATTATNIVEVNEAYTKAYYNIMFDRLLELGSDTVIVKKTYIEETERLIQAGADQGYELIKDFSSDLVFKIDAPDSFGTKVSYEYLAIGRYASNVVLAFPEFTIGEDDYIDHYTLDQLKAYKKLVVTGFKYDDKDKAEALLVDLSKSGVDVYVDLSGMEPDMYSMRAEFLDVIAQPLNLKGSYPALNYKGESYVLKNFLKASYHWNTLSMANLDIEMGTGVVDDQEVVFYGTKNNDHLRFVGLNLLYYIYEQRDEAALDLVGGLLGVEAESLPLREIVPVTETIKARRIEILAQPGTLMPMAKIDAFVSKQSIDKVNNLSLLVEGNTNIDIVYPFAKEGWIISMIGIVLFGILLVIKDPIERFLIKVLEKIIGGNDEI